MSVLTALDNKTTKKPQYKDYVSFLGNYKSGRKDDQCSVTTNDSGVSFSLNNSSNNSSSSINSDLTDMPKNAFKEYLEQYNSKKYCPVQPAFIKKTKPEEAKTMKTEVYIQVNNHSTVNQVSKVFEIHPTHDNPTSNVSKVSKMFEKNVSSNEPAAVKTVQPNGKVNTFKFEQKEPEVVTIVKQEHKKTSIGEISKKFEANSNGIPHKIPLKKTPSICEKSKLFEDPSNNDVKTHTNEPKQKEETTVLKITVPILKPSTNEPPLPKSNGSTSPKPPISTNKPTLQSNFLIPPPPPPPSVCPPQTIPFPPPQPPSNVPPPPPPPPANFTPKNFKSTPGNQKPLINGTTNGPIQNGRKNDVVDGVPAPVVDKNDPRVKRMVYGALREMYGAYHDKANDYIATLPRNRVKKNNGLDSIINSIA